ncbi:DUF2508 family protein [Clostridium vincentii]|uniref:DUF2508 family protein n=1 Tax=Clostridium vincentii TaxID=52704 RepID=A0A2T0BA86_9CLOT|nr:DUF2508 family protein [Clostridium vincentii]PRR80752.1 hypothetical protein CLVI_29800 [Clostridium vincentii]
MNKNKIIEYVIGKMGQDKKDKDLLEKELLRQVEYTLIEIETARRMFNSVEDPKLIEVAIYSEEIAKQRFDYLLSIARERGISVSNEYIVGKFLEIVE